jgi:hypothetical protein
MGIATKIEGHPGRRSPRENRLPKIESYLAIGLTEISELTSKSS